MTLLEAATLDSVQDVYGDKKSGKINNEKLETHLTKMDDIYGKDNLVPSAVRALVSNEENDRPDF